MCCTSELNYSHFLFRCIIIYFFLALREWSLVQRPSQRRPLFPFKAVTLLCNQLLQYSLELPKQIGNPTKHRTTVVPHCGSFCRHSLSGAECRSSNEWNHRGWGGEGGVCGGGASSSGDGGGEGVTPWNLTRIPEQSVRRVERSFSHLPGFQGFSVLTGRQEGFDKAAPFLPTAFKASFPLTHHAAPRLISVTSTTEGQGFFFYPPLLPARQALLPFCEVESTFFAILFPGTKIIPKANDEQ